jgi:hypothetical protein
VVVVVVVPPRRKYSNDCELFCHALPAFAPPAPPACAPKLVLCNCWLKYNPAPAPPVGIKLGAFVLIVVALTAPPTLRVLVVAFDEAPPTAVTEEEEEPTAAAGVGA